MPARTETEGKRRVRAALLTEENEPLVVTEVRDPDVSPDGVIVRTGACGVCRTDVHHWLGDWEWLGFERRLPLVLGHEMAGEVVEVGRDARRVRVGDRVTAPFHLACGACERCTAGQSNLCRRALYLGSSVPGAFAEYVAIANADLNCIPLPEAMSDEAGATLGCRYTTVWHGLVDLARVASGETVVVVGAGGGVGACAVQLSAALGARVIAVDVTSAKLDVARRAGADLVLDGSRPFEDAVREAADGGADVTLDAVARHETLRSCLLSLRAGGRHVQIGMTGQDERGEIAIPIDRVVAFELKLFGVSGNPHASYPAMLDVLSSGRCDPAALIGARIGLGELNQALTAMRDFTSTGIAVVDDFGAHEPQIAAASDRRPDRIV